jgi:hypothetical protein|tara:strand:- start:908 stop:1120 length:213 start_codon:yes stop_codon:yes gene_type:complete
MKVDEMDLYPNSQDFMDGFVFCKKNNCHEQYVHFFLESYRETGNSKYSKNNAVRLACMLVDTNIINLEIL